jgi:hypothetical protein
MKKYFEKNKEENFESMDSTFTPIGREDCASDKKFGQRRYMKPKIYEVEN